MDDDFRILEIKLHNYRQYYGTVDVKFPTDENTLAVLIGANGAGKSNFWNAIHWCLFGNEPHESATPIINMSHLYEVEKSQDVRKVDTYVQIIMHEGDTKYLIRRKIEGQLHRLERTDHGTLILFAADPVPRGVEIINRDKSTLFQISQNSRRWETLNDDRNHFATLVNERIIPEHLSHFFILDGEFLQKLFDKFEDVKSGIGQISQIPILDDALDFVTKVRFQRPKGIGNTKPIHAKITEIEQKLRSENRHGAVETSSTEFIHGTDNPIHVSGEPRLEDLNKSALVMQDDINDLERKINESNAYKKTQLEQDYRNKREERTNTTERRDELLNTHLERLMTDGPFIMCKPSIECAAKLIRTEVRKGKLPNNPKRTLVNELLDKRECLCHTRLDEGTDARKFVKEELDRVVDESQYDLANDILQHNESFLKEYNITVKRINEEKSDINYIRKSLKKIEDTISTLKNQVGKTDTDYGGLISKCDDLRQDHNNCQQEIGRVKSEIERLKQEKGNQQRALNAIKNRSEVERKADLLLDKSDVIKDNIRNIKNTVEEFIKNDVSKETLEIYNNLSWKKNYTDMRIDDKYHIRVIDDEGLDVVGGMSAGEKLFLALSFIMALKRVTKYKFPFVIDSPLGKTGGNLRIRFGKHMPELLDGSQLIMLVTNTEYSHDPLRPEDGGKESSLIDLLKEKATIQEYTVQHDKESGKTKILEGWVTQQ